MDLVGSTLKNNVIVILQIFFIWPKPVWFYYVVTFKAYEPISGEGIIGLCFHLA